MEDNLIPIPINELLNKQFFIPHYQRGYRWIDLQVKQLLDDIDAFDPREIPGKPGEKTFYCLQPVVVKLMDDSAKSKHNLTGEWYEVIDGQQRLTTIYLIIQYINDMWAQRKKRSQFTLNYETREDCVKFLQDIRINDDELTVDINKSNIDFYHISKAYQSIRNWEKYYFSKNVGELNDGEFQSKFFAYSKIIWYKVSGNEKGQELFARLNIGKIPLTNAELTKALFLSNESFTDIPSDERRVKQFEIARLWDQIEHKLNEPDKKFWSFITNKKREKYDTKIEMILDLISGKNDSHKDEYHTFLEFTKRQKSGSLLQVWREIEHFYYTINEWFSNKDYYHKIGYLVTSRNFGSYKGVDLGILVKDAKIKKKEAFKKQIDDLISESVKVELSELRYDKHYNQLFNVLLLFNVETNRTSDAISEFYPFKQHKDNLWSLEHIHARQSEYFDKTKRDPWLKWLELHKNLLDEMIKQTTETSRIEFLNEIVDRIKKYHNEQLTWDRFSSLFKEINDVFTSDVEAMDRDSEGLRNLALLSQPDNSALNNSVFEIKRREIIDLDKRGSFIPICTRRAFMKYYNEEGLNSQSYFWSEPDRETYFKIIESKLNDYLSNNNINDLTDDNE
jgi:uncharacterized protein with ParB-like and HNH nuclease domain